ncbi:MAG TPA: CarD family transcriptional regulator, partial [Thermodesulfovibrionales bacterium]|nr:CarD family transcriptional regulator [Thermodesulfovibrionales bacterium]
MHNNNVSSVKIPTHFESFFPGIPPDASHIYNLAGSSVALFLALRQGPFIAVEETEEAALRLYEDIQFFLDVMHVTKNVFFLPEPNGPEASGKRTDVVHRIREEDSVVTSIDGMDFPLWLPDDLRRDSLFLAARQEMEREKMESRLRGLGYKRVSIVMDKGEYSSKGWLIDIFPVISEFPVRVEFFGDEIEHIKSFDIGSQRSIGKIDNLLVMPIEEPLSGITINSLVKGKLFLVDSPEGESRAADDTGFLSKFDIKGAGHDAGLRSMRGLGIYPNERTSFFDLTDTLKALSRDTMVVVVSSSEGQAERVKEILFDGGIVAPVIDRSELPLYEGAVAVTRGRLSSGFFLPGFLLLTEKEIFGERPLYRAMKKSRVSELLASIDDIAPGDFVVHRDHGIGRFVGLQKESSGGYESDLIAIEYSGSDRLYIP